ncbi:MAG: hypothetical protein EAZ91_06185 [Cytophagales bacterium]|nr:MAG: hypothetical protein EAZ91_06185 [Cytophagales bacterium]
MSQSNMKITLKSILVLLLFVAGTQALAQLPTQKRGRATATQLLPAEIRVPMDAANWPIQAGQTELVTHQGLTVIHILPDAKPVVVNSITFANGIIEYDVMPGGQGAASFLFRRQSADETECVYMRAGRPGNPAALDGIQYAPYVKGLLLWDLMGQFQAPVPVYKKDEWNHLKYVVSGSQMLVYVNDMQRPVLEIPRLEGNIKQGGLAFDGTGYVANLVIRPNETEELPAREGFDPTAHDPRYLRQWQVSQSIPFPAGQDLFVGNLPKTDIAFQPIQAERRGLVNLSRLYGPTPRDNRRMVWLKVKVKAITDQTRKVSLGFSDEVWVFLNQQPAYIDKNIYRVSPTMRKVPDGRISIENGSFDIALKAGENELLIGLSNDFWGWGLIARLDSMEGITVLP